MNANKIIKTIREDILEEFDNLKKNINVHLQDDYDIKLTKKFLSTHIPREVMSRSDVLLDTLLNYLMDEAGFDIKKADVDIQNIFYDMDFRNRIKQWVKQLENNLILNPDMIRYSSDPRIKQGLITGGITFVAGAAISATIISPASIVAIIISGVVTLVLSIFAFKIGFDKGITKAREIIKSDINNYLVITESQITEWLKTIIGTFSKEFSDFCTKNGIIVGDKNE